jgi:hypothetical protein
MEISISKKDFDNFVHYSCKECGWTPLNTLFVAFTDYCKWFKNYNDDISNTDFQSFINKSNAQIQGTPEHQIVVGLTIVHWVKFSKCTHCDTLISYSKNVVSFNYSNSQSDFCSYECLEASGFKQMHEEECQYYNDEWLQESYF